MRHKRIKNLIVGGALIGALFITKASAYNQEFTHPALTDEIFNFYNLNFTQQLNNQDKTWLIQGSIDEDQGMRPMNHFYDPIHNIGIAGFTTSKQWAMSSAGQSNFAMSNNSIAESAGLIKSADDFSYQRAMNDYAQGDRQRAMIAFGHLLHLLEDAGVPDHTRNDPHPPMGTLGSPYEHEMAKWNPENFNIASKLKTERLKPVILSTLGEYFDKLAKYSNGNFFSKDTISNDDFDKPSVKNIQGLSINGRNKLFIVGKDKNGDNFPLASIQSQVDGTTANVLISKEIGSYILDGYWDRLSKEVVLNGAGALNLFLVEAEKAKTEYANSQQNKPNWFSRILGLIGISAGSDTVDNSNVSDSMVTKIPKVTNTSVSPKPLVTKTPVTSVTTPTPSVSPSQTPKPSPALLPLSSPKLSTVKSSGRVVINEIAWAGTSASATDEWIELYNTESGPIDISSWQLVSGDDSPDITFSEGTVIQANSYFLIERTDDSTVNDITADLAVSFGQGGLNNTGEMIRLFDSSGTVVDVVGGAGEAWYFGDSNSKNSMERIDPVKIGNSASNWKSFSGTPVSKDATGNMVNGTPKNPNSKVVTTVTTSGGGSGGGSSSTPTSTPSPSITPSPSATVSPTPLVTPTPSPTSSPSPTPTPSPEPIEKININTASKEQLITLSGIGEVKANAIIEYRTTNGPFQKIEDIMKVSGIKQATFDQIKDHITVGNIALKPQAVADLIAGHHSPTITATWSAPDSGGLNVASLSYDLRYSTINFPNVDSWDTAMKVASSSLPSVGVKGTPQSASFNVAYEYGQTLYFALKTGQSDISNISEVSFVIATDPNSWVMVGKDQNHTSFASNITGPGSTATISWEFDTGRGNHVGQPVISDKDDIYFGSSDGKFYSLDKNGSKNWQYSGSSGKSDGPVVLSDGVIYFGHNMSGSSDITALNSDGSQKWIYYTFGTSPLTLSRDGSVYFSSWDNNLNVLKSDGSLKWQTSGPFGSFSPILLGNGNVINPARVSGTPHFYSYSSSGSQVWDVAFASGYGFLPSNPSFDLDTGKINSAVGPYLVQISEAGELTKTPIDFNGISTTMVSVSPNNLIVGFDFTNFNPASGSQVIALDKSTRGVKWRFKVDSHINNQIAIDKDENVYFSTQNGKLYRLNSNGELVWVIDMDTSSDVSPVLSKQGVIWGYGSRLVGIK